MLLPSAMPADLLTAEELRALDAVERYAILSDLYGEVKRLADLKMTAIDAHASARITAARTPTPELKARVLEAKRDLDVVGAAIQARKLQMNILQTLLRSQL